VKERGHRKIREGRVVSDKMSKTATVEVVRQFRHPFFNRVVRRTKKFKVHDEKNQLRVGDLVRVIESRPLSRTKRWRLLEVVEKAR